MIMLVITETGKKGGVPASGWLKTPIWRHINSLKRLLQVRGMILSVPQTGES